MIVITTPTGRIGSQIVERLLDGPGPARVVVRDPARLDPRVRERVEVVAGSHGDAAVLAEAFDGAETVFWVVPPDWHGGDPRQYYLEFTRPACAAFTKHGVRRVVAVTSLGHGYPGEAGHLTAAMAMDEMIRDTGVDYRALAAPFFMENLLGQAGSISGRGAFAMANLAGRPLASVATRDIAAAGARLLLDSSWTGQSNVPVAGPEDLTPLAMADIISAVLARPVRFEQISVAEYREMLTGYGLSDRSARGLADIVAGQNDGIYDYEPHAEPLLAAPTTFRDWCEQELRPAVEAADRSADRREPSGRRTGA